MADLAEGRRSGAELLELFVGRCQPHSAQVFARVRGLPGGGEWRLRGELRGPTSELGRTLPTRAPFRDLGPGDTLLAASAVVDPVRWTPQMPALYEVRLELLRGAAVQQTFRRLVGIPSLSARGRHLFLDSRRFVLRAVAKPGDSGGPLPTLPDWAAWRDAGAALVVPRPADELLEAAAAHGVFVVVECHGDETAADLSGFAAQASVGMFWYRAGAAPPANIRDIARHQLLIGDLREDDGSPLATASETLLTVPTDDWRDLLAAPVQQLLDGLAGPLDHRGQPILAVGAVPAGAGWQAARAECDRMQAEVATQLQCAGFLVMEAAPGPANPPATAP